MKQLVQEFHLVLTRGGSTSDALKEKMDEVSNLLWLYASDDVMKALSGYLTGENAKDTNESFKKLIWAMRKDLIGTKMTPEEVNWFRAT